MKIKLDLSMYNLVELEVFLEQGLISENEYVEELTNRTNHGGK